MYTTQDDRLIWRDDENAPDENPRIPCRHGCGASFPPIESGERRRERHENDCHTLGEGEDDLEYERRQAG